MITKTRTVFIQDLDKLFHETQFDMQRDKMIRSRLASG